MVGSKNLFFGILILMLILACNQKKVELSPNVANEEKKSAAQLKTELTEKGFQIFDYVDEKTKDTVLMQEYYIAFLKSGPNRDQPKAVADSLQMLHMAHLGKMYELGYADISGPFGDDGDIRGITIYNTPSMEIADSLANADPMVKAGRLKIEIHPWWAAKGFGLR
ncbi:YciI family protein [Maribacter dokdonensis]|uniref:YciI family protein n=1 Tax=Maribacter dokdonensis TaxID=320912 RepID=UPI0032990395